MTAYRGLLYIKHAQVGTRSEGPEYHLQTARADYVLRYHERHLWERDYELEFYGRRIVAVIGKVVGGNLIHVSEIRDPDGSLIGQPGPTVPDRARPD
jgi:hypothetical protein